MSLDNCDNDVVLAQSDYDKLIDSERDLKVAILKLQEKINALEQKNINLNSGVNHAYTYGYNSCEGGKKFIYGFTVEHLEPLH